LLRFNEKVGLLLNKSESVPIAEVIGLESEIGLVKESVDRYGFVVSECLDLEEVPEMKIANDDHFQRHCSFLDDLSDIRLKLRTLRLTLENRIACSTPLSSLSRLNKLTSRIDTALKPDELRVDGSLADFKVWRTSFGDYYSSNHMEELPHREQQAYLWGCLDIRMIQVMEQLLDVTESMEVEEVLETLQRHFEDCLSVMTRRVAFHRCTQRPGELFSDFFVRLKLLGSNAELDNMSYDDQLATRIVVAVQDKDLQRELLKIETPGLAKIKTKCLAWETAYANQQILRDENGATKVNKAIVRNDKIQRGRKSRDHSRGLIAKEDETLKCKCCGRKSHSWEECFSKDKSCHGCGRKGHRKPMCPAKKNFNSTKSGEKTVARTNAVCICLAKNHVGRSTPLADVTFRLNSGLNIWVDGSRKCRILTANGSEMACIGVVELNAKWGERESLITAFFLPDTQDFILLWHDMVALGMIPDTFPEPLSSSKVKVSKVLKTVQFEMSSNIDDPDDNAIEKWKNHILYMYQDVFDSTSSLKAMRGPPMHIHLENMKDCRPIHCTPAIPVAYSYEKDAKAELEYMEKMDVIEDASEPTEWVLPFLALPKPKGGIRLVVDFCRLNQFVRRPRTLEQLGRDHPGHLYRKEWDQLSADPSGRVVLDSTRILVPSSARKEMLKRLHLAHQGIVRTKSRARGTLFWHGMMNDVVQMINACNKCQTQLPAQTKEPLKSDAATEFPFQLVSTDLFEFGGQHFLVLVDRYTGWPQMDALRKCPNTGQNEFDKTILEWRNTPRQDGLSPAQWLYGRQLRTMMPVLPCALGKIAHRRITEAELNRAQQYQNQKKAYDEHSRTLFTLEIGTKVCIQDPQTGRWEKVGEILRCRG
ncbi:hypothetical protein TCAL_12759, partial [Tigriopus californicus]